MNYGGVIIKEDSQDFIAGSTSPIALEPRNTTGNWHQFLSTPELQRMPWGDTFGCVSFTAVHHQAAVFLNWGIANNLFSAEIMSFLKTNGYIGSDGKVNLSERYIVVQSGTTPQGNTAQNVLQAIRTQGLVPEAVCPNLGPQTREEYFTIPQEALNLGQQFTKLFTWGWQAVPASLIPQYIVQAPIMELTAVCAGWDTDNPVKACNQPVIHATGIYATEPNGVRDIIDTYVPFEKRLASDYQIPYAYQLIGYPIKKPDGHQFLRDINPGCQIPGERSQEVIYLQERLGIIQSGIYDEQTRAAVYQFQIKNNVASLWEILFVRGRRVGSKTRAVLNK